jgi:hypothetical protein
MKVWRRESWKGKNRKEEEGATKKEIGSGYHKQLANECIRCGTSCL